jgi:glycosyltransferase involved in cell wall biosynthesis
MKILVFCDNYPRPGPGYADSFVRFRLESYRAAVDAEILVVKLSRAPNGAAGYVLNGVKVEHHTRAGLPALLQAFAPDVVLAHFIQTFLCKTLPQYLQVPLLTWIHGEEALSWKRRLFYLRTLGPLRFVKYIASNTLQRRHMARLFRHANAQPGRFRFIFVSDWMRRIAEADVGVKLVASSIIPNFVNGEFFRYVEKGPEMRKRILLIRSFNSAKYANDIAVAAIAQLRHEYVGFDQLQFTIVGEGALWEALTARIKFPNVTLVNRSLDHEEIRQLHREHGVFLCPTRQDAQGVSMCEAMASGLVPVASNNTAIPEFLSSQEGYLCNGVAAVASALAELADDPILFARKSAQAARRIRSSTGVDATINREIALIRDVIGGAPAASAVGPALGE